MKRKPEICDHCKQFVAYEGYGKFSSPHFYCLKTEEVFIHLTSREEFFERDVPEECVFLTEQKLIEWNKNEGME